jgi:bud site selection protein 20
MWATSIRYCETDSALQSHWRSKVHKRRCRALKEPAYTIEESERAAGLGRDVKRAGVAAPKSDDTPSQS